VEDIEVQVEEEREPWTLPMSIFKPRLKESDARNFFDTPAVSVPTCARKHMQAETHTETQTHANKHTQKRIQSQGHGSTRPPCLHQPGQPGWLTGCPCTPTHSFTTFLERLPWVPP